VLDGNLFDLSTLSNKDCLWHAWVRREMHTEFLVVKLRPFTRRIRKWDDYIVNEILQKELICGGACGLRNGSTGVVLQTCQ
jgi:hypothetical protein